MQNDELIAKLQPSSSKCICLDEEKTPQQELAMETLLKRREELKPKQDPWKQRAGKLRTRMDMRRAEDCVGEKYKVKIEETAKDLADKVTQLDLFLQTQRASQATSEELICTRNASIRSHLEFRTPLFANFSR
ncbi:ankyrin repeat domain-containing protein 26-like [Myotis myotis]|uniref:ankyrin repeat domain-containing protein 26-like n=1 Tax=Myotis myotis TaxID=51298 RepID=UPI00174B89A6|nr:ankyrin repeat domain-containing protein 26-like [Myotis myotis]